MADYSIGISGLNAAQKAFNIIGNNISNAATEGYHRQRVNLSPQYAVQTKNLLLGGGVQFDNPTRLIDTMLEQEIRRQSSSLQQTSEELQTLQTVETTFGELATDSGGLNAAIDDFFNSLKELSSHPDDAVWQNQAVSSAQTMTAKFRELGKYLTDLEEQIVSRAQNDIKTVNQTITQISRLNNEIERMEIAGGKANNLRDERDKYISQLSEYITVETVERDHGVVDIMAGGIPVVTGTVATNLEAGMTDDGNLGITAEGAYNYRTQISGGKFSGLINLKNELIDGVHSKLDNLARTIIGQVNRLHTQGNGSKGSFTQLQGWPKESSSLSDFDNVTDGSLFIRLTDTSTGQVTRHQLNVDKSSDSLISIANDIDTIPGLSGNVTPDNELQINAASGYEFDFLPGVKSEPLISNLNGDSGTDIPGVEISGLYEGSENQIYTCTVVGNGQVGNDENLRIKVEVGGSEIKTVDVGTGYSAGDELSIGDGLSISLSSGQLNNGEQFMVRAVSNSDTSGLLNATGLNCFFSGDSASDMEVASLITNDPAKIAVSRDSEITDNTNIKKIAELADTSFAQLKDMNPSEYYSRMVTELGQDVNIRDQQKSNIQTIMKNLENQQTNISGVNINDEAAQLLLFEQMFQGMAKYLQTVESSMTTMMRIVQ